ncbi:MAG: hypothetical protein HC767_12460 [Akkermansiaceae bacterium]|nr:hypothetical protein [Akkermansiaceae bacterium]
MSAEVDFHGPNLLEKYMKTKDVNHMRQQFSNAVEAPNTQEFENMMKAYGTEVVGLVGAQVLPRRLLDCEFHA